MPGAAYDWDRACQLAAGVDQVCGVHQTATLVTLITAGVLRGAGGGGGGWWRGAHAGINEWGGSMGVGVKTVEMR